MEKKDSFQQLMWRYWIEMTLYFILLFNDYLNNYDKNHLLAVLGMARARSSQLLEFWEIEIAMDNKGLQKHSCVAQLLVVQNSMYLVKGPQSYRFSGQTICAALLRWRTEDLARNL